jgi:hypothetical protein
MDNFIHILIMDNFIHIPIMDNFIHMDIELTITDITKRQQGHNTDTTQS